MGRTSLPPGFRFHPTDVELVMYYLKRKVMGKKFNFDAISELNIYKFCPWDLPDKSCLRSKDLEWFFFCPRERKYASGARTNRATENGYWKTTGKDRHIIYREKPVGMVRTLVFHTGHAPQGIRTDWVMHEYRIADKDLADDARVVQDAYVLCKVFQKSGPGPKNGAQYGAPFNEEDWNDDEEICAESSPIDGLVPAMPKLPNNQDSSVVTSIIVPGNASRWSLSESGPSTAGPSANNAPPNFPDNDADINSLLAMFTEDSTLFPIEICSNENLQNLNRDKNIEAVTCSGGNDIYNGLGDLGYWGDPSKGGFNLPSIQEACFTPSPMLLGDDIYNAFLELNDLSTPVIFRGGEGSGSEPVPTDSSCAPYKCDDTLEQFYYGGHCLGPVQNVSQWSQSPLLPEVTNRLGNHFDVLHRENGIGDGANQGYNNASSTTKGSTDAAQNADEVDFVIFSNK